MSKNATKTKKALAKAPVKSWEKKCEESGGMSIMLPQDLIKDGDKFAAVQEFTLEKAHEFDAVVEDFKHANEEFWYTFKKYCRDYNIDIPEKCEMELDEQALEEGKFVINFTPSTRQGGQGFPMNLG